MWFTASITSISPEAGQPPQRPHPLQVSWPKGSSGSRKKEGLQGAGGRVGCGAWVAAAPAGGVRGEHRCLGKACQTSLGNAQKLHCAPRPAALTTSPGRAAAACALRSGSCGAGRWARPQTCRECGCVHWCRARMAAWAAAPAPPAARAARQTPTGSEAGPWRCLCKVGVRSAAARQPVRPQPSSRLEAPPPLSSAAAAQPRVHWRPLTAVGCPSR